MNNKSINFKFLNCIIENDLILMGLKKGIKVSLKKRYCFVLNLFFINKAIKQLVRSLYFLSNLNRNSIYVLLKNKMLIELFSKLSNKKSILKITSSFPKENFLINSKGFFIINEGSLGFSLKNLINLFNKNFFLINTLNFLNDRLNNFGIYNIQSELDDLKKISFFLILINQSLITNKNAQRK